MKLTRILLLPAIMLTSALYARQAKVFQNIKKINQDYLPQVVQQAIKRDFPDGATGDWGLLPVGVYAEQYKVEYNPVDDDTEPDYYDVALVGKNFRGDALYDKNGDLVSYRAKLDRTALPQNIVKAIALKYPEAVIENDHEIIKEGKSQKIVHYKIHISEGRKHEYFLVDENGTVLRTWKL